jgi:uncharacterized protein YkwD
MPTAASPTDLLERLNRARAALGHPPLRLSPPLNRAAQRQADELTVAQDLEGALLDARIEGDDLTAAGYRPQRWIQAVANSSGDAETIIEQWMEQQPDSYELFLDTGLLELGIGVGRAYRMPLYSLVAAQSQDDHYRDVLAKLADLETVREQIVDRVNAERAAVGLPPLRPQHQLQRAAQSYAEQMRTERFYGHVAPDGTTVLDRVRAAGYRLRRAGENLANGPETVAEVMAGWMDSRDHRENILSRRFTEIGLGIAVGEIDGQYQLLWVLHFGLPRF